jgi:diguanylate cyclase (GGDEF)-like protein
MPTRKPGTRLRALIGIAAGLLGTAVLAIGLTIWWLRVDAVVDATADASNLAIMLSEQTDRSIQSIDLMLNEIQEHLEKRGATTPDAFHRLLGGKDTYDRLMERMTHLSHIIFIAVVDNKGRLVVSTNRWPLPPVDVSDREHFQYVKNHNDGNIYVSKPFVDRLRGIETVVFNKRLNDANNNFLGAIGIGVRLSYFEHIFGTIKSLSDLSFLFLRRDGSIILRYPDTDHSITKMPAGSPWYQLVAQGGGHYRSPGYFDRRARLVAVRPLRDYPLVIGVGVSEAAALAGWRNHALFIGLGALLFFACIALLFTRLSMQFRDLTDFQATAAKKTHDLERAHATIDAALNNMSQGLIMFDSSERMVVCNQRYLELYGLSAETVRPGCPLHDLLQHRVETGTFSFDEVDRYIAELRAALSNGSAPKITTNLHDGRVVAVINTPTPDGGWVATHEDITEVKLAEERITHVANHDALTGLANRSLFSEMLEQALRRVRRGERLALLYLDLDHLKRVNDTLGHPIGDQLLKQAAARLRGCVRDIDLVARLSGDEFAVIQSSIEDPSDAAALATRIREAIIAPYDLDGHQVIVDISVGISIAPNDATELNELLKTADIALYEAKNTGRGIYCFYESDMNARMQARGQLERDLRNALANGEFELFYQPIVRLKDNSISGFEALLRWRHPERGMISPAEFVPVAEEMGLIIPLGEWVLRTACAEAATWPGDIKVAVNLSSIQLTNPKLVETIIGAIASARIPAAKLELELEITESAFLQNTASNLSVLRQLHELGVQFAMDDFGTGYSSLGYLLNFPFHKIKIDRSFITGLSSNGEAGAIVRAIANLARDLKMAVIAEGVESEWQLQQVKLLGCTEMQGYLFSPPRPRAEIHRLFLAQAQSAGSAA